MGRREPPPFRVRGGQISNPGHPWTLKEGDEDWIGNFTDDALNDNERFWSSPEGQGLQEHMPGGAKGYADTMLQHVRDEKARRGRTGARSHVAVSHDEIHAGRGEWHQMTWRDSEGHERSGRMMPRHDAANGTYRFTEGGGMGMEYFIKPDDVLSMERTGARSPCGNQYEDLEEGYDPGMCDVCDRPATPDNPIVRAPISPGNHDAGNVLCHRNCVDKAFYSSLQRQADQFSPGDRVRIGGGFEDGIEGVIVANEPMTAEEHEDSVRQMGIDPNVISGGTGARPERYRVRVGDGENAKEIGGLHPINLERLGARDMNMVHNGLYPGKYYTGLAPANTSCPVCEKPVEKGYEAYVKAWDDPHHNDHMMHPGCGSMARDEGFAHEDHDQGGLVVHGALVREAAFKPGDKVWAHNPYSNLSHLSEVLHHDPDEDIYTVRDHHGSEWKVPGEMVNAKDHNFD